MSACAPGDQVVDRPSPDGPTILILQSNSVRTELLNEMLDFSEVIPDSTRLVSCAIDDSVSNCIANALAGDVVVALTGSLDLPDEVVGSIQRAGVPLIGADLSGDLRFSATAGREAMAEELGRVLGADPRCEGSVTLISGSEETPAAAFAAGAASVSATVQAAPDPDEIFQSAISLADRTCVGIVSLGDHTAAMVERLRTVAPAQTVGVSDDGLSFEQSTAGDPYLEDLLVVSRHPPLHDGAGNTLVDAFLAAGRSADPEFLPTSEEAALFVAANTVRSAVASTGDSAESATAVIESMQALGRRGLVSCGWTAEPCEGLEVPAVHRARVLEGRLDAMP